MDVSPLSIRVPESLMRQSINDEKLEGLKLSLSTVGMINPITVREEGEGYELVAGYRRLEAAKSLRWEAVPIIVMDLKGGKAEAVKIAENVEREEVSAVDEGEYLHKLMSTMKLSQRQLSDVIGKSEGYISKRLATMRWSERMKLAVDIGAISFSGATALMMIKNPDYRSMQVEESIKYGASLSLIETWVENWNQQTEMQLARDRAETREPERKLPPERLIECAACKQEFAPDNFDYIRVDEICGLLLKEPEFIAAMRANRAEVVKKAGQAKPLAEVLDGPPSG